MHSDHRHKLEYDFSNQILAQVQCTIDNYENELQQQHDQESDWNFVLLQIRRNSAIALTTSKRCETEQQHKEVDKVTQENVCVDVSGYSIRYFQQFSEEIREWWTVFVFAVGKDFFSSLILCTIYSFLNIEKKFTHEIAETFAK